MVRVKRRYILIKLVPKNCASLPNIPWPKLSDAITLQMQKLYGDQGVALLQYQFSVKYVNEHTDLAVISTSREAVKQVRSSLVLVQDVAGHEVSMKTMHISGTIRQLAKVIIQYHKKSLLEKLKTTVDENDRLKIQQALIHCMKEPQLETVCTGLSTHS